MAVTATAVDHNQYDGPFRKTRTSIVLDSAYVTGGEPVTAADLGLQTIDHGVCELTAVGAGGIVHVALDVDSDQAGALLVCYTATGEVANATDLDANTVEVTAWGH